MSQAGPDAPFQPRCKVWIERDGQVALSDWRIDLLRAIDQHGSLAEAARQIGVPYRTAWYKLKEVETRLGIALLVHTSGGATRGGAVLTPTGKELVSRYEELMRGVQDLVTERFEREVLPILRRPPNCS